MENKDASILASITLAVGGIMGLAGTFAPTASLRGLAWGIDGLALVMASALLAVLQFRRGRDFVAAGFLVFAIGQGLVVSGAAMELAASTPSFGAGCGLWAGGLALISVPQAFPLVVRLLGMVAAAMLGVTALQIFGGAAILPTSSPLPFFAYPFLVATLFGWIWALLTRRVG
jgi:hypothetical protein